MQSVDITAAHMLNQIRDMMRERGITLLLSNVREQLPNGRNLVKFFRQTGLIDDSDTVRVFPTIESAIEWVEDRLVGEVMHDTNSETLLNLNEMEIFQGRKDETMADLETRMQQRFVKAGDPVYSAGDQQRELYLIRRGAVIIMAPIGGSRQLHHIATFGRSDFFGGLAFLDDRARSENAIASTDIDLYVLPLDQFNKLAEEHKRLALLLITAIARTLAHRLRHADGERNLLHR